MIDTREHVASRAATRSLPAIYDVALSRIVLVISLAAGGFLRVWQINVMGYNTDEAVYAGQAAAIAGVPALREIFPIFRAHPLLFQFMLAIIDRIHFSDVGGRYLAAAFGIGTIFLTY